ncbi:MAG: cysteine dioxygenase family protein [Acidiferrobacterales bacterium]
MKRFVDDLEGMALSGFEVNEVHSYLAETMIEPASLDSCITYRRDRYTRNLVHKTEALEILVICWGEGHKAPVHGHEGELCWARVERGKLRFTNYQLVSEDPLVLESIGDPVDGEAGYLDGPADIHAVENPLDFAAKAASLHVYSRPYPECDIYDLAQGERRRVRMVYDTMHGESVP